MHLAIIIFKMKVYKQSVMLFRVFGVLVGFFSYYVGFSKPGNWVFLPTGHWQLWGLLYLYLFVLVGPRDISRPEDNKLENIINLIFFTTG